LTGRVTLRLPLLYGHDQRPPLAVERLRSVEQRAGRLERTATTQRVAQQLGTLPNQLQVVHRVRVGSGGRETHIERTEAAVLIDASPHVDELRTVGRTDAV